MRDARRVKGVFDTFQKPGPHAGAAAIMNEHTPCAKGLYLTAGLSLSAAAEDEFCGNVKNEIFHENVSLLRQSRNIFPSGTGRFGCLFRCVSVLIITYDLQNAGQLADGLDGIIEFRGVSDLDHKVHIGTSVDERFD